MPQRTDTIHLTRNVCTMAMSVAFIFVVVILCIVAASPAWGFAQESDPKRDALPTVGTTSVMSDVIIAGPELIGKPIEDADPMIVRITDKIVHGDGFRYRIEYQAMEPGSFDLMKFLIRKDGEPLDDLKDAAAITVEIQSLLPPGQIKPNELQPGWIPRMGGYRILMSIFAVLWGLGLLALIFLGHKKKQAAAASAAPTSLAQLLKQRIETARQNKAGSKELAELERMLTAFWQKKLKLESESPHQAIAAIRQHPQSADLMKQIEAWIHRPDNHDGSNPQKVDWQTLLEPYADLPADALEGES